MLSPFHPFQLAVGLAVWIAWFASLYGALAIACEVARPPVEHGPFTWINATLLLSTLAVTFILLHWARACRQAAQSSSEQTSPSRVFIANLGAGINLMGAVATLCVGLMVLLLPPCL